MKKITKEECVIEFRKVHGDKYDYSKLEYNGVDIKSCMICHEIDEFGIEHGEFWQTPYNHKKGCGCPKCAGNIKMTLEEFIKRARKVHGDKYDYSKVAYKGIDNKVCIICPIHGEFWQTPNNHLHGQGCPKCVGKQKNNESFLKQCIDIHGDIYDHAKTEYKGAYAKTTFICHKKDENGLEHGEFQMTPHDHLRGRGCPKCGVERRANKQRKTLETLQKELDKIYGENHIDISNSKYINAHTPITININGIGERNVTPNKLLSGVGCKLFKESILEQEVKKFLEKNNIKYEQEKKFTWLKYKSLLRLDFYLPDYNIAIECQGKQHFVELKVYQKKYTFDEQIKKDEIKFNLCKEHDIPLFYFTNTENKIFENKFTIYNNNLYINLNELLNEIKSFKLK